MDNFKHTWSEKRIKLIGNYLALVLSVEERAMHVASEPRLAAPECRGTLTPSARR